MALVISYLMVPLLAAALIVGMEPSPLPAPLADNTLPGCPSKCGNISIPYPFGIAKGCSWPNNSFSIFCNRSYNPPRLYYGPSHSVEVIDINLDAGEMRVFMPIAHICYDSPKTNYSWSDFKYSFGNSSAFVISHTRNEFTAVGCRNIAFLQGADRTCDGGYLSGCITTCASVNDAIEDGAPCSGNGCCQTAMPIDLDTVEVGWSIGNNTAPVNPAWNYSSCIYGFIAEKGWYNFSRKHLSGTGNMSLYSQLGDRTVPLVLDWSIRNKGSCEKMPNGTLTAPACVSANSICVNVRVRNGNGTAYRCNCSEGYQGNPYLKDGCNEIDECLLREKFPKMYGKRYPCGRYTICYNVPGKYKCECKIGYVRDPKSEQGDCRPIVPGYAIAILVAIVSIVVLGPILFVLRKEQQRRVRRGFFDKNGGEILERMDIKTFTEAELDKMTNHYSELIGTGHFGKVFSGIITDSKQRVAVKCPILDGSNKQQQHNGGEFVDEITFQFKLHHPNLVRLIGCCLETNVPRLVFEFISNGSLFNELHGGTKSCRLSLTKRLDIAIGSAEAISYMHSNGDQKHVHGDIKSANILLDGDLMPKVSDFGSSKLLSIDMFAQAVAADINYVDPVYMKTNRFRAKSDVYSFGIVLLELITRKQAMYDGNNSLPLDFVKCCKEEGNGRNMYDRDILSDGDESQHRCMECLDKIGVLAVQCLKEDVHERPTMAEVVEELKLVKLRALGVSSKQRLVVQLQGNRIKQNDLCFSPGGSIRNRHIRGSGKPEEAFPAASEGPRATSTASVSCSWSSSPGRRPCTMATTVSR